MNPEASPHYAAPRTQAKNRNLSFQRQTSTHLDEHVQGRACAGSAELKRLSSWGKHPKNRARKWRRY
jgi:hypothetical protein